MADAIEHYHALGFLTEWERGFALNTQHKRRLSDRQALHRRRINNKVMRQAGIAERLRRLQLAEAADE